MALFTSAIEQQVFYLVYGFWFFLTFILEPIYIRGPRQADVRSRRDRGSMVLIFFSVFVALFISFGFAQAGVGLLPDAWFYPGITIMVVGILIREWAILTLREYFSFRVRILQDHKVIEAGPYRVIRHPSYTGAILTIVGVGVALRSWAAVLVLIIVCALAYGYRIFVEEKVLVAELGTAYKEYMGRTKRLIPFIF